MELITTKVVALNDYRMSQTRKSNIRVTPSEIIPLPPKALPTAPTQITKPILSSESWYHEHAVITATKQPPHKPPR